MIAKVALAICVVHTNGFSAVTPFLLLQNQLSVISATPTSSPKKSNADKAPQDYIRLWTNVEAAQKKLEDALKQAETSNSDTDKQAACNALKELQEAYTTRLNKGESAWDDLDDAQKKAVPKKYHGDKFEEDFNNLNQIYLGRIITIPSLKRLRDIDPNFKCDIESVKL